MLAFKPILETSITQTHIMWTQTLHKNTVFVNSMQADINSTLSCSVVVKTKGSDVHCVCWTAVNYSILNKVHSERQGVRLKKKSLPVVTRYSLQSLYERRKSTLNQAECDPL